MVINRVEPLSVAKLAGMLYAILGLNFGGFISLIALAGGTAANADEPGAAAVAAIFGGVEVDVS
jgi:hypothetical protein